MTSDYLKNKFKERLGHLYVQILFNPKYSDSVGYSPGKHADIILSMQCELEEMLRLLED